MFGAVIAHRHPTSLRARILSVGLALPALLVAFAAVAWACNPQAHISVGLEVHRAGDPVFVYGSYFPPAAEVSVSASWGASATVTTSAGGGGFITELPGPAIPGNYSVSASRPTGGFAAASFTVEPALAPPPAPPPPPPPPPPALPSPGLVSEPDLLGPQIVRPAVAGETVRVSRAGSFELFCGRVQTAGASGTCGAKSGRSTPRGRVFLQIAPRRFEAQQGRRVVVRFKLSAQALRRLVSARRVGMVATVVARDRLGNRRSTTFRFALRAPRRS